MTPDVGQLAPDFSLVDSTGAPRSLASLVAARPLVLVFYRGHWCPFCLRQLEEYARMHAAIGAAGADVAALSVDSPERAEAMRRQLALPFPVLSDSARAVVREWDVYNAGEKGGIAIPSVFVIGPDRRVRWRSIDGTVARVSTDGVLGFLRDGATAAQPARKAAFPGLRDWVRAIGNVARRGTVTPHASGGGD